MTPPLRLRLTWLRQDVGFAIEHALVSALSPVVSVCEAAARRVSRLFARLPDWDSVASWVFCGSGPMALAGWLGIVTLMVLGRRYDWVADWVDLWFNALGIWVAVQVIGVYGYGAYYFASEARKKKRTSHD